MRDFQLLREYVDQGSQTAFAQIVDQHMRLVYSVCLRDVRDPSLADDATQVVFLILARKASSLRSGTMIAGWLYNTARFVSKNVLKQEKRRRLREEQVMQEIVRTQQTFQDDTEHAEPFLNDALSALSVKDRETVLLHLLEGHTLAETGAILGLSEDAARMRVSRAVLKMRRRLASQGAILSAAGLAGLLASKPTHGAALPSASLIQAAMHAGTAGRISQLTEGTLQAMKIAKLKTVAVIFAASCFGTGGIALIAHGTTATTTTAHLATAPAQIAYKITDLGTLGGDFSFGNSINDSGQVVGQSSTTGNAALHAFVYSHGTMTDLRASQGTHSYGNAINAGGQVTGNSGTTGNATDHAFIYTHGAMTDLGTLGGLGSSSFGINATGEISGASESSDGSSHAFLYSHGKMTRLEGLGGANSKGFGINDHGQTTGFSQLSGDRLTMHAFLYTAGTMTDLGTLGGSISIGYGINDKGQVVGDSGVAGSNVEHAFLYSAGKMTDLGTLGGHCTAMCINNNGVVVGESELEPTSNGAAHAIEYSNGHLRDLNTLIDPKSGWLLRFATHINNRGQITGGGLINGQTHGFLLTPINPISKP